MRLLFVFGIAALFSFAPIGTPAASTRPACPGPAELKTAIREATRLANFQSEDAARAKFREILARFPKESLAHQVYGNFLYNFFSKREGYAEAVRELEIAAADPRCTAARFDLMRAYSDWGVRLQQSRPKDAIENFTRALKYASTAKERAIVLSNRGIARRFAADVLGEKAQLRKAIADFDNAIKEDPSDVPSYMARGLAKLALGDDAAAEEDLRFVERMRPDLTAEVARMKAETIRTRNR